MNLIPGDKFSDYYGCYFTITHCTNEGLSVLWQDGILEIWDKKKFISDLEKNRFFRIQPKSWSDLIDSFKTEINIEHSLDSFVAWLQKRYKFPESI